MIMITNEDDVVVKFFSHYLAFIVQHYTGTGRLVPEHDTLHRVRTRATHTKKLEK